MMRTSLGLLSFALVACTDAGREMPEQHLPEPTAPRLTLLISNQSFDLDTVDIRVTLDDQLAVTGDFVVGSQHTWVPFELDAAPGSHTLRVTSGDSSAQLVQAFVMDDRKWGVVNFWYDEDSIESTAPVFTWNLFDEQPLFD